MIVNIKKLYKRNILEVMMFGYVNSLRFNMPTVSIEKAILNFMKHHSIDEEALNLETAKKSYYRMQNEYIESQKADL